MKGTEADETKPHFIEDLSQASFVCKHVAREGGRGRERRKERKGKKKKRRCSQLRHKRPRTHQEEKRRVSSYDESIQGHPNKQERKERKEKKREREGKEKGVDRCSQLRASVQGHTSERGVPECYIQEHPNRQRRKRGRVGGWQGIIGIMRHAPNNQANKLYHSTKT